MEGVLVKNSIEIGIKELLALIVILDEFEVFNSNVINFLNSIKYSDSKLKELNNSKKKIGSKKIKNFLNDNKEIINVINSYSDVKTIIINYYLNEEIRKKFYQLYEYLLTIKDRKNQMVDLILKLDKLGIKNIVVNTNTNFKDNSYCLKKGELTKNDDFYYLDNMYVIPSYQQYEINYKTKESNYEIKMQISDDKIIPYEITINNLLMDINKLPNKMNKSETFDKILLLKENAKNDYKNLKDIVDVELELSKLKDDYYAILNTINNCNDYMIKKRLIYSLNKIQSSINDIELTCGDYKNSIIDNNRLITEEVIEKERVLELSRRKVV